MKRNSAEDLRQSYGVDFIDPSELQRRAELRERQLTMHPRLGRLLMVAAGKNPARIEKTMRDEIKAAEVARPRVEEQRSHTETVQHQAAAKQLEISARQQQSMVEYVSQRNAYSFVKNIPRRPSREGEPGFHGDYQRLAAATLTDAVSSQRRSDGSVALLGPDVRERHAQQAERAQATSGIADTEAAYNGGIATTLWQLGFIEAPRGEEDIHHGRAQFNSAISWSQDSAQPPQRGSEQPLVRRAQLPFDANNELHAMLVPDDLRDNPALTVELEFSSGSGSYAGGPMGGESMNLRVVPIGAPQSQ
jgi:hypothetical protein